MKKKERMQNLIVVGHPDEKSFCYNGIFKTIKKTLLEEGGYLNEIEVIDLYRDSFARPRTDLIDKYKELVKKNVIEIRHFNDNKWSKYSHKKSTYILSPKDPLNLIIEESLNDTDKDPRNINKSPVVNKPNTVDNPVVAEPNTST